VFASLKSLLCQSEVGFVGRAHDDELDGRVCERLFDRAEDAGFGPGFGGLVSATLHDSLKLQAGDRIDEWGVKDLSRKAEADDCYSNIRHETLLKIWSVHFAMYVALQEIMV